MALDWDILNENCSDISDWEDQDMNSGVSSQATFDGKSTMKLYAPDGSLNIPIRNYNLSSVGTSFTFECKFYIDVYNSSSGYGALYVEIRDDNNSSGEPYSYIIRIIPTAVRIYNAGGGSTNYNADVDIEEGGWHILRFSVENRVQSLWVDDRLYLHGYENNYESTGYSANEVFVYNRGDDGDKTTYLDWIRMDSSFEQISTSPLNIHNEKIAARYRQNTDDATYPNGQEKLRLYGNTRAGGNAEVLSVPLVSTGDTNASKVRIYDGSSTKSLMKLPI